MHKKKAKKDPTYTSTYVHVIVRPCLWGIYWKYTKRYSIIPRNRYGLTSLYQFSELVGTGIYDQRTSGPLTHRLQQNGIRLPTVDHTEGGQASECSEDTAALSAAWFHVLYSTSVTCARVQYVLHHAIYILHWCTRVFTVYCTVGSFDDHTHHGTSVCRLSTCISSHNICTQMKSLVFLFLL